MGFPSFGSPPYFAALGLLCGVVGFRVGWRLGFAPTLPLAQGLFAYFAFLLAWVAGGPWRAAISVAGWALGTTAMALPTFFRHPERADRSVLRAPAYRREMLEWLRTSRGPETRPMNTAWAHLRELAVYLLAAALTANLLGLVLGAILLNYMNAYVATLLRAARRRVVVALLAWNVWSLIRVASYILLGTASAAPLLRRLGFVSPGEGDIVPVLTWGFAGVVLDLVLKLLLSRTCGRLLASAVDLELAEATGQKVGASHERWK